MPRRLRRRPPGNTEPSQTPAWITSAPPHTAPTISGQKPPCCTAKRGSSCTCESSVVEPVVNSHAPTSSAMTTAYTTVWMNRPRISSSLQRGVGRRAIIGLDAGDHRDGRAKVGDELVHHAEVDRHARCVERIGGPL